MGAKQMGGKLFQGVQALGKSGLCSGQLAGDCCKAVPQSTGHLNAARPCGVMKMAKSCQCGTAANQRRSGSEGHRFVSWCQQGLFTVESPLKCTLPLMIWIHNINSCVRCIGWLYICFTCERCDMSSGWWQRLKNPLSSLFHDVTLKNWSRKLNSGHFLSLSSFSVHAHVNYINNFLNSYEKNAFANVMLVIQ